MRKLIAILLTSSMLLPACTDRPEQAAADIVFLNGGVYTVDAARSWAEAAAIRDGLIIAVGSNSDVQPYIGKLTEVVDLDGRMAMPGIHDSHVHPLEGAYEQVYCNLWEATESVQQVVAALQACDENHEGEWFQGVGLYLGMFGLNGPDKSLLDGIAAGKYVFLDGYDGHAALVNDKLLDLAGFDENTPDPVDGVIERRERSREPNGTVRESARDTIDRLRPKRDLATSQKALRAAIGKMNSFGITSVYDAWVGEHEMQLYKALDDAGELSVRVLGAIIDEGVFAKHVGDELERVIRDRANYESDSISFDSIKFMVDGVIEGETAAMIEPYHSVGHAGLPYRNPEELNARVKKYYDMGLQLHFHTYGDRAVHEALNALEFARNNGSEEHKALRHTLAHLALVDPADLPRFAQLNAAANFTMSWAYYDEWSVNLEIPAIGEERAAQMYPMRSVQAAGGVVLGGSDWNYGELDPLLSIEPGVTRDDPYGPASPGVYPVSGIEAVDLATMIDAYTINGAWQLDAEDISGSIETGKRADLVVYDRNLFAIDPYEISEARVDLTIFDGRVVYRRFDEQ